MSCFSPLSGYFSAEKNPSGKRGIVFNRDASFSGCVVRLPCGRCIGCRMARAETWAQRCMHEKRISSDSAFVTLTYDDKSLPLHNSLDRKACQLFMKRLRKEYGNGIRFFGAGEYGGDSRRPHYHYILFNVSFPDKKLHGKGKRGEPLYYSPALERLWPYGFNTIGDVTIDSARYVAKYVCDKITGDKAVSHYQRITEDGEIVSVCPEFGMFSLRPGIGQGWFDRFGHEVRVHDSVVLEGKEYRPARFYDLKNEVIDAERMSVVKKLRRRQRDFKESSAERRRVREKIVLANLARNRKVEL